MIALVILAALMAMAMAVAAAILFERNRRLRTRSRKGSRYFSVSLTNPDAPARPDDHVP